MSRHGPNVRDAPIAVHCFDCEPVLESALNVPMNHWNVGRAPETALKNALESGRKSARETARETGLVTDLETDLETGLVTARVGVHDQDVQACRIVRGNVLSVQNVPRIFPGGLNF